ncbi:PREDICTED: uncharacterized protein LOC105368776 [Ceratosolen solmsi marchali]|uniref:Uncharacterized protein LOC105368776 n=1 Tax=Ceratosolen solmsi marchali TaxID=326594 RepID=A0AAJ7E376_9HYME|nr:PREDICTED: uncharacterized protein LOC105368776 [Ceratosolen solmsi marchali]
MSGSYEPPDDIVALDRGEIRRRYRDTALVIFKEQQLHQSRRNETSEGKSRSYLSFGVNRRTVTYTNNGNEAVVVHRTTLKAAIEAQENLRLSSRLLRMYRKPRESCTIS